MSLAIFRYIEYETSLDELMKLRRETNGIKAIIGKGEVGCVKRCHVLYERATRKFKGDLRLWLNWLEFCRASHSPRQMSKVPLPIPFLLEKISNQVYSKLCPPHHYRSSFKMSSDSAPVIREMELDSYMPAGCDKSTAAAPQRGWPVGVCSLLGV